MDKKPNIAIYIHTPNSRVRYVLEVVFQHILGMQIIELRQKDDFISYTGRKLYYGNEALEGTYLSVPCSAALLPQKNDWPTPYFNWVDELPYWEWGEKTVGTDPLPMLFFMLSRMEEYSSDALDKHGRFPAEASVAYQMGGLSFPIVDAWADWFRKRLNQTFPSLPSIPKPPYTYQPTYDIDHVRAYLWKGWRRSIGATARDIIQRDWGQLGRRFSTYWDTTKDPYDCFDYLDTLHHQWDLSPIYFWLLGDYGPYDKNPHWQHPSFQSAIRAIAQQPHSRVGIHPSYPCLSIPKQIKTECQRLAEVIGRPIRLSRFHFLRFQLPVSYRALLEAGITDDYTLGYPEAIGFRAGTSHSFPWYDVEREETTSLMLHPLIVMDVSLKDYLAYSPKEALAASDAIIQQIKKYGGTFTTLWHNSSFWEGWEGMYEDLVRRAVEGV